MIKKVFTLFSAFVLLGSMCITGLAYADNDTRADVRLDGRLESKVQSWLGNDEDSDDGDVRTVKSAESPSGLLNWSFDPALIGTVTAVNGSTIIVKAGQNGTIYTVDTNNATVRTATGSTIAVGDTVLVQGAINGTSVVATSVLSAKAKGDLKKQIIDNFTGIVGQITAINGTTVTVLGKNNVTYTITATNAKIWKNKNKMVALSDLKVGDTVIVQGTINGSAVTATNIYPIHLPGFFDRAAVSGTVTAISDTTITLKSTDGTVYTITTATAKVKVDDGKDASLSKIKVGDVITVTGSIAGTTVTADMITDGSVRGQGIFQRLNQFFKRIFKLK
jgi:hypothetical protein